MKTRNLAAIAVLVTILIAGASNVAAATLYVSPTNPSPTPPYGTWDTAAHTIQEAVDAASDGDTVLVAPGQYDLTNQITVAKAIAVQSTMGAGHTFLNSLGDIWCLWISNSLAVADGFMMQNTSGAIAAGGAFLVGGTVQNCNFTNFTLSRLGASVVMAGGILSNSIVTYNPSPLEPADGTSAIYCSGGGLITDCQILGDGNGPAGMGVYLVDSQLRNSLISGVPGGGLGSGVAVHALSSAIAGCTITRNHNANGRGGGAYLDGCLMDRCIVAGNRCGGGRPGRGGGGIFETNSVIRNSLIVSNAALVNAAETPVGGLGGGVYMQGGALDNCTVSANEAVSSGVAPGQGGGIYVESGTVRNSIVYFNSASVNANWYNGSGSFDHSCTTPDPGGVRNLVEDPQFVGQANGNCRLGPTSPCIDAGANEQWMLGATDLDGSPRIHNGTVDLGAWESQMVNTAPVARIQVESSITFLDNPSVITLNASSGEVILDGSQSSDAENDPLTYTWSVGDPPEAIATGSRVTAQVPTGSHVFQLQVSDGELTGTDHASVAVLTPCDAIALLSLRISESSHPSGIKRPLLDCLQVSCNSFDHGNVDIGIQHLENFQVKVAEELGEVDPAFAELLTHAAQTLINAIRTE